MRMSKRILYVGNDIRYFLMHRLHLATAARDAGFDVHAAMPKGDGQARISESGITYHPIILKRGGLKPLHDMATIFSLCKLYKSIKPDIIHHHTIKPVIYGGFSARLTRQPNVVSGITGLGYSFIRQGIHARIMRFFITGAYRFALDHQSRRVIFQNSDDMGLFVDGSIIDADSSVLIKGSGVDLLKFKVKPEPDEKPSVMLVSRMLWDKGIGEFVEAAKLLKLRGVESRFILVGDVDDTNPGTIPREQMRRWNSSGVVEWMGWVDDVSQLYEKVHIVCLPSHREGVPRSLIEAAACGKPIVTTDSPGCREIVRHGENGYLVPIGDPESLADALQKLIESPDLRRNMGFRSREIAESEFSIEKVVKETLDVYRELLQ